MYYVIVKPSDVVRKMVVGALVGMGFKDTDPPHENLSIDIDAKEILGCNGTEECDDHHYVTVEELFRLIETRKDRTVDFNGRSVIINDNLSVTYGCTTLPKDVVEKVVAKWQEMGGGKKPVRECPWPGWRYADERDIGSVPDLISVGENIHTLDPRAFSISTDRTLVSVDWSQTEPFELSDNIYRWKTVLMKE